MNDDFRAKAGKGSGPYPAGPVPEAAIRRRTASAALQHPTTLLPLAVCLAATGYLLLLSPMFGGGGGAAALAAICGAAAAASYLHRYAREYPRNAREMAALLEAERIRLEEAALEQYCNDLRSGFLAAGSAEGIGALEELMSAYGQLRAGLAKPRITDPLSIAAIAVLSEETYRRGLSALGDALELIKATGPPGDDRQLEMPGLGGSRRFSTGQLLQPARRCATSLQAAHIELASVRAGGSKTSVDSVVEALERTLNQVKEVQDELERLGRKGDQQ